MSENKASAVAQSGSQFLPTAIEPFLFLYITEKCQLRCTHCYMGDRLEGERHMSVSLVEEILASLRILYGQHKVYLLGGEPTSHPNLSEILHVCRQQKYKVVLTSNGLIPSKVWASLNPHGIDAFSFSLDGACAITHEAMRGSNTFPPLITSMHRAVAEGFQTRAIYTVTTENYHEIPEALNLADTVGLDMISFHYFTPTGLGIDKPYLQLAPTMWMELCEKIRQEAECHRVKVFYPPAFVRPAELSELAALGYRGCTARNLERLAIFPDRRVYICSAFFDTDLHYGEFLDGRIIPCRDDRGTELTLVNAISYNCRGCTHSSVCRGGCAAYDYFDRTLVSNRCDQEVVPICPLWSRPVHSRTTASRFQELR